MVGGSGSGDPSSALRAFSAWKSVPQVGALAISHLETRQALTDSMQIHTGQLTGQGTLTGLAWCLRMLLFRASSQARIVSFLHFGDPLDDEIMYHARVRSIEPR